MTTFDPTSTAGALAGVQRFSSVQGPSGPRSAEELGQSDFLMLLTTQLQNQDPFAPMESGEFLGQMAQFSTISGIEDMNNTLQSIGDGMTQNRIATASSLLGQHVLVPGSIARADQNGMISGAVDLEYPVDQMTVNFEDALTGEVLHTQNMRALPAGMAAFEWRDVPQDVRDLENGVRINITTTLGFDERTITPSVFAKVMGVHMAGGDMGMNLDVQDFGVFNSMEVEQIR